MGVIRHRAAKERIRSGEARAKERFLRGLVAKQVVGTCLVAGLWLFGGVPGWKLGLGAPPSWWLTGGMTAAAAILLVASGLKLRARSAEIRRKLDERAGALIPDTAAERRWFAAVC